MAAVRPRKPVERPGSLPPEVRPGQCDHDGRAAQPIYRGPAQPRDAHEAHHGPIAQALRPLPLSARRSVTFDRGSEFVDWPHLQAEHGARTWFCDPQSPWQKGSIENTNKRLGRWICRDPDPETITTDDLRRLCAGLNATPRKCLGYSTPAEVFRANIIGHGYRTEKLSRRPKSHLGQRVSVRPSGRRMGRNELIAITAVRVRHWIAPVAHRDFRIVARHVWSRTAERGPVHRGPVSGTSWSGISATANT